MISLIIKSYLAIILSIAAGSALLFLLGLVVILRAWPRETARKTQASIKSVPLESKVSFTITSSDISAIAGDDAIATQLDLARAYIETGRQKLAKKILDYVLEQGDTVQQAEALRIMNLMQAATPQS